MCENVTHGSEEKRVFVRPKFHPLRIVLNVTLPVIGGGAIGAILYFITNSVLVAVLSGIGALALYVFFRLRDIAIFAVRVYQRVAPERIRDACVFTPTCSEYMIMALQKYGFFKGLFKGIGRLRRCHLPNGGEDYP